MKKCLHLFDPKVGLYTSYSDTIYFDFWFLQYRNLCNNLRVNCTVASLRQEVMEDNEVKDRISTCDDKIKQKNSYYFIYALWYIYTFRHILQCLLYFYIIINCNLVCCGIRTIYGIKKVSLWTSWMIYVYYIHMHIRDHVERYMCYLRFIRLINHRVVDMQQFQFKASSSIPYKTMKTYCTINDSSSRYRISTIRIHIICKEEN